MHSKASQFGKPCFLYFALVAKVSLHAVIFSKGQVILDKTEKGPGMNFQR